MTILCLPAENRLQILAQLPLSSLLNLQFLSRELFQDVHDLFSSRRFVLDLLDRLYAHISAAHKDALDQYLQSADARICEDHVHTMFVLIHLMKGVGHLKDKLAHVHHRAATSEPDWSKIVEEIVKRCQSAARLCQVKGGNDLWSAELKKMLYPQVTPTFLDF